MRVNTKIKVAPRLKTMLDEYFKSIEWEMDSEIEVLPDDIAILRQLINESSQTYKYNYNNGRNRNRSTGFYVDT